MQPISISILSSFWERAEQVPLMQCFHWHHLGMTGTMRCLLARLKHMTIAQTGCFQPIQSSNRATRAVLTTVCSQRLPTFPSHISYHHLNFTDLRNMASWRTPQALRSVPRWESSHPEEEYLVRISRGFLRYFAHGEPAWVQDLMA